jgi:hypothetical protein
LQNLDQIRLNFKCRKCERVFPKSELSPSKVLNCDYRCKRCCTKRMLEYFKEHPQNWRKYKDTPKQKAAVKRVRCRRRIKIRTIINKLKQRPCTDCQGWFEPCQMQFDHLDGSLKKFDLSSSGARSLVQVLAEVAKCEVVCANCHALRTTKRQRQSSRRRLLEAA